MAKTKRKTSTKLKIIGATATALFSLFSLFTGTLAWFASNASATATGMSIAVVADSSCQIDAVNLYKFEYPENTFGTGRELDYQSPQDGSVSKYTYEAQTGFGVDSMNVYDPIEKVIYGNNFSLRKLNCNAVYEVVITSEEYTSVDLDANVFILSDRNLTPAQKALSDYVDFDLYSESELADVISGAWNPLLYTVAGEPLYLPTSYLTPLNVVLTAEGAPASDLGEPGDKYLNLTNNDVYVKGISSWGNPLSSGISSGEETPSISGEENAGDYYVKTDTHHLYRFIDDEWVLVKSVFFGEGEPEIAGAKDDLYLDISTRDLYIKGVSIWTRRANLTEEKIYHKISYLSEINKKAFWSLKEGISSGEGTPNPASGNAGDYYVDTINNDLYIKAPTSWGNPVAVTRGTGVPEDAAADGAYYIESTEHTLYQYSEANQEWTEVVVSLSGRGSPADNAGNPGDFYIDTANNDLYIKAPTSWGNPLTITKGNSEPVVSDLRKEGDYYIKTDTHELYRFQKHAHFYEGGDPTLAKSQEVDFNNGEIVLYVNVNYAPDQLEQYTQDIYLGNIEAVYDFAFSFGFTSRGNE